VAQSSSSPTPHPAVKQAAAQPGVPVAVPESMRRPLNKEEMEKALQQLPPEVRARIMGMQKLPPPSPQPTKK
jgi:methionyl-tRNA formyltransferase